MESVKVGFVMESYFITKQLSFVQDVFSKFAPKFINQDQLILKSCAKVLQTMVLINDRI